MNVGTCSLCGGRVSVPDRWMSTGAAVPTCEQCGAVPVETHGPVIPMRPRRAAVTVTGGGSSYDTCEYCGVMKPCPIHSTSSWTVGK
jgi:hypothetical protein